MLLDLAPSRYVHWRLQNHATRFPTGLWSSPRLRPPVGCEQSNPSRGRATTPQRLGIITLVHLWECVQW